MKRLLKFAAAGIAISAIAGWKILHDAGKRSDKAACGFNQRYLHQAVDQYRQENNLKPGDPLDWSKLIGPGLLMEETPACPVHGDYPLSPVIPERGTLAAPCGDPEHQPTGISDC